MGKVTRFFKFCWIYTSSLFLPTAIVTERVEKALKELEEEQQREEAAKAAKAASR